MTRAMFSIHFVSFPSLLFSPCFLKGFVQGRFSIGLPTCKESPGYSHYFAQHLELGRHMSTQTGGMIEPWPVWIRWCFQLGRCVPAAAQGLGICSVRLGLPIPSASGALLFYSSWLAGSLLTPFVSSFIKGWSNPGGDFQDLLPRIWPAMRLPRTPALGNIAPPRLSYLGLELSGACFWGPAPPHFSIGVIGSHKAQEEINIRRQR